MAQLSLCKICMANTQLNKEDNESLVDQSSSLRRAELIDAGLPNCALCFGLLNDARMCDEIAEKAKQELVRARYDDNSFLLALNVPISMHIREMIFENLFNEVWVSNAMSPKGLLSLHLLHKIGTKIDLRPSLNSPLILTVSFENDEFLHKDLEYLLGNFPSEFNNSKSNRKRRNDRQIEPQDPSSMLTRVKVNAIANRMNREIAEKFKLQAPAKRCEFSVSFERNPVFIAGRYCKFSRTMSQTPWSADFETQKSTNCVSEKLNSILLKHLQADSGRFSASGREDIDVRMLGTGRPFVLQVINPRKTAFLKGPNSQQTLTAICQEINAANRDICINSLTQVSAKQAGLVGVGQEDKRKIYSALCYSKVPLTDEMFDRLRRNPVPIELLQKTVVRVLRRRPLLVRKRNIFAMSALQLDDYHFMIRLETQAGTYVKEFVHGDFGRTRPSLAELMGQSELDGVDILELDVEAVDLEWPPKPIPPNIPQNSTVK